jgi:hypothetical protein
MARASVSELMELDTSAAAVFFFLINFMLSFLLPPLYTFLVRGAP